MADMQPLLAALEVFSQAPDKASLDSANAWLQDFQHSPDAWATCNLLLTSADAPPAAKVFAAQTFRTKVTYDLEQVDQANLLALRDTLLASLDRYHSGPRNIIVQLCLAISGFALQVPAWNDAIPSMIETFGRNPATVPALLQFLTLLPEELNTNTRIPITDDEYKERAAHLLTDNAEQILQILSMYINAPGVTSIVQSQVFKCLRSWLTAGEIAALALAQTPLLNYAFEALGSDQLFDDAVDVVCDIIHETQELDDNMDVIQLIVPRVIALKPKLAEYADDPEKIKGFARIFAEAGETYRLLLLRHPDTFFPIVEAIGECSAYSDLDVVPITFPFWMRLSQLIGKKPSVPPLFINAYKALMSVVIRHLHFPPDSEPLTGQEAENFRSFRHVMGDTLKDCCYVLGTDVCLLATYDMITAALARGAAVSWQDIEAPLFSMRSMGAELDVADEKAVPKIMDLIPSLPDHPRVRYAALLIISRYTEWINAHPQYVSFHLQYISQGFQDADADVNAAAGQALKYLCQDCKEHLTEFLPQLHSFVTSIGSKLSQDDQIQVYEAIAHVISAMPMEQAAESLRTFALVLLAQVHTVAVKPGVASREELKDVCNAMENLECMLHVIRSFGDELPVACRNTCQEAWDVLDPFLAKYGATFEVSERTTRVLRHGITLFGASTLSVAPAVLSRMSLAFESTGFPGYLWISGKIIGGYGVDKDASLHAAIKDIYERSTNKVISMLQGKPPGQMPDVLEDYLQMLKQMIEHTPDILFESTAFVHALRPTMAALTLVQTDVVWAALDFIRLILNHNSLEPSPNPPPKFPIYASAISQAIEKEGFELLGYILAGLIGEFPEESVPTVVTSIRSLASLWPSQLLAWLPLALQGLPAAAVPMQARSQFLVEMNSALSSGQIDKVRYAVLAFHRASRKARDRRRVAPLE